MHTHTQTSNSIQLVLMSVETLLHFLQILWCVYEATNAHHIEAKQKRRDRKRENEKETLTINNFIDNLQLISFFIFHSTKSTLIQSISIAELEII